MKEAGVPVNSFFWKLDIIVSKIVKIPSFAGPVLLAIIAILATANVIISKTSGSSIPSVNDWIMHLMIPIVWLSLGNVAVNRSLIRVDFISKHYPDIVNRIVMAISYLIGAGVTLFICMQQIGLMKDNVKIGKMSSTSALNFPIWPFNLILVVGLAITTFAFLWCVVRQFAPKKEEKA